MDLLHTVFEPRGNGPHPTPLMLHGWGASALDLLDIAPYLCSGKFFALCPQGPLQIPLGGSSVGYGWFPITMGRPLDLKVMFLAREELRKFPSGAEERYPIDSKKLVVLGFSQSRVMVYSLGLSEPERFSELASLSSWLPPDLFSAFPNVPATEQLPVLIQHGNRDELVDVGRARQSVETLRHLRVQVTYSEYNMRHEINTHSLTDLSTWLQEKVLSSITLVS